MTTIFDKPLDKQIASNTEAITNLNSDLSFETITSGNFNSYTASGGKIKHYCGSNVNSFTNAPSGLSDYAFSLDVFPVGTGTTYTKQVLHYYGTTPATFERQQYWSNGVQWGGWQQLALKSDSAKYKTYKYTTSGSYSITLEKGTYLVTFDRYTVSSSTSFAMYYVDCIDGGTSNNHASSVITSSDITNVATGSNFVLNFTLGKTYFKVCVLKISDD